VCRQDRTYKTTQVTAFLYIFIYAILFHTMIQGRRSCSGWSGNGRCTFFAAHLIFIAPVGGVARPGHVSANSCNVQTQKIVSYMRQHSRDDGSVLYTVAGQEVCETCFRMVYGIRYKRYSAMKAKFRSGTIVVEHGHLGRGSYTRTTVRVVSWLRMFINKVGDHMPSKPQIHLPSCLTKSDVYALACLTFDLGSNKDNERGGA